MSHLTSDLDLACKTLLAGELVVFPTETVYGLGALANNEKAVSQIFTVKNRPKNHPLILHLHDFALAKNYCIDIPRIAYDLANKFMPGPITFILKRNPKIANLAAANLDTVAIRVPSHPIAQKILQNLNDAVAAPSANLYTRPSATSTDHVLADFANENLLVVDGGTCEIGIESTIINIIDNDHLELVRPGFYTINDLQSIIKSKLTIGSKIAASGNKKYHYSPKQKVYVLKEDEYKTAVSKFNDQVVAAFGFEKPNNINDELFFQMPKSSNEITKIFYQAIRQLEKTSATIIVINELPDNYEYLAINDRLKKASADN